MDQAKAVDESDWYSVHSDGRPAQEKVPLGDVIQAIWERGQHRPFIPAPPSTKHVPNSDAAAQD
jgi:hypothetical protein